MILKIAAIIFSIMPITFKSKHAPNILMLESVALELIKMMGHSGSVPSSLAAQDISGALERLRAGVASSAGRPLQTDRDDIENDRSEEPAVSLAHRSLPLIEMLETALREGDYVIWDR